MSSLQLLYLCGVIAAFIAFALTLAWGESQTRNFVRPGESDAHASRAEHELKKAA